MSSSNIVTYSAYPGSPELIGLRVEGRIEVDRANLLAWLKLQDGGAPWAIWGQGLLEGAARTWTDGTPCVLAKEPA